MKTPARTAALAAALLGAVALLAYETGGTAYTKRLETKLLAEPKPLAEATGKLTLGRKVKVEEVQGAWLRISDGPATGWVFGGNLSTTAPAEGKGADGLGLSASQTTATAAARGLAPATADYAGRRNLGNAQADLDWLVTATDGVTAEEVDTFMQEMKKGEFQ